MYDYNINETTQSQEFYSYAYGYVIIIILQSRASNKMQIIDIYIYNAISNTMNNIFYVYGHKSLLNF